MNNGDEIDFDNPVQSSFNLETLSVLGANRPVAQVDIGDVRAASASQYDPVLTVLFWLGIVALGFTAELPILL